MPTITELLQARMRQHVIDSPVGNKKPEEALAKSTKLESSEATRFLREQAAIRRIMGAYRYERKDSEGLTYEAKVKLGQAKPYYIRMQEKLTEYIKTGNLEMIVDCYNYCILEVNTPSHSNAHFESTERVGHE